MPHIANAKEWLTLEKKGLEGTEREYMWDLDCNVLFFKSNVRTKSHEKIASIIIEAYSLVSVFYYDFYFSWIFIIKELQEK